jgi:chemotaxis protein methyltransferase CheR
MILDETASVDGLDEVSVLGTDINGRALARAREGVYGRWSLRGLDDEALARYFQPLDGGRYSVRERYRRNVTFLSHNLASPRGLPWPAGTVDVIFCRNVLIYFDGPLRERLLDFFHRSLAPGGWLIVAPCETSALVASPFRAHHADGVTLYRKGGPEPVSPTAFFDVAFGEPLVAAVPEEVTSALLEPSLGQEEPQGGETLPGDALFQEGLPAFEPLEAPIADDDLLRQARQAADGGRLDEAVSLCLARLDQDRTDPEAFFLLSMIYQEQGEAEEARGALRRVLFLAPDFLGAHYALAMIELGQGRKDQARRHFRNALSLLERMDPEEPVAGGEGMRAAEFRALLEARTL